MSRRDLVLGWESRRMGMTEEPDIVARLRTRDAVNRREGRVGGSASA